MEYGLVEALHSYLCVDDLVMLYCTDRLTRCSIRGVVGDIEEYIIGLKRGISIQSALLLESSSLLRLALEKSSGDDIDVNDLVMKNKVDLLEIVLVKRIGKQLVHRHITNTYVGIVGITIRFNKPSVVSLLFRILPEDHHEGLCTSTMTICVKEMNTNAMRFILRKMECTRRTVVGLSVQGWREDKYAKDIKSSLEEGYWNSGINSSVTLDALVRIGDYDLFDEYIDRVIYCPDYSNGWHYIGQSLNIAKSNDKILDRYVRAIIDKAPSDVVEMLKDYYLT